MAKKKTVKKEKNPATDDKHWYSPIYRMENAGFYVTKHDNSYYLGFRNVDNKGKNIKSIEIIINKVTFDVLQKEWG